MGASATTVGRFAPSPTGPLHFGSLVAAVASYLQSRSQNGQWLLRIEDIDPPREMPGADELIIAALERYAFRWDGEIVYQSRRSGAHQTYIEALFDSGHTYACTCSRKMLSSQPTSSLGVIYPGTCRNRHAENIHASDAAIRVRTGAEQISFHDGLQGYISQRLQQESGDFVIRRRDGLVAYHLAVVVDDHLDGVTEIVRGIDLLDSTPRQIYLQQLIGIDAPSYLHIPVVVDDSGDKLSKINGATAIPMENVESTLFSALRALQQEPPDYLQRSSLQDIWSWATKNWQVGKLSGLASVPFLP